MSRKKGRTYFVMSIFYLQFFYELLRGGSLLLGHLACLPSACLLACLPPACLLACRLPATSCPCRLLVPVVSRLLGGSVLWPGWLQPGFGRPVSADCTKDNSAPEAARLYSCLLWEIKKLTLVFADNIALKTPN